MVVSAIVGSDDLSGKLKDYCSGLPDVEKKVVDGGSADGQKMMADYGISSVPMVVILDEDGKELFKTADMTELEKFFS